ncbi:hypothetical protein KR018_007447 [Drosophila ironensis]|nr:hypothetical protein KR018_007447 [Drosophila ironensis]
MALQKIVSLRAYQSRRFKEQMFLPLGSFNCLDGCAKRCVSLPIKIFETLSRSSRNLSRENHVDLIKKQVMNTLMTRKMEQVVRDSHADILRRRVKDLFSSDGQSNSPQSRLHTQTLAVSLPNGVLPSIQDLLERTLMAIGIKKWNGLRFLELSLSNVTTKMEWSGLQTRGQLTEYITENQLNGMRFRGLVPPKINTKLEWKGLHPCHRNTDPPVVDAVSDVVLSPRVFHMRISSHRKWCKAMPRKMGCSWTRAGQLLSQLNSFGAMADEEQRPELANTSLIVTNAPPKASKRS